MHKRLLIGLACLASIAREGTPATWYVDGSVSQSGDGSSWKAAFKTIQEGIGAASAGDTVTLAEGLYLENIHFRGKNITVTSADPLDPNTVAKTIIDANGSWSPVSFSGTEDETSALVGLTVRGGRDAGVDANWSYATIACNTIQDNSGGAIAYSLGAILNNIITRNSAACGAGLYECHGPVRNNTITGNTAQEGEGAALRNCEHAVITNCIIWANGPTVELHRSAVPTYSCVPAWVGGEGNISSSPYFVDAENADYRLKSWSPCVDAGDPASDFSREPDPNGGRIDVGAYGNTVWATSRSPDTDADALPDDWEMESFGNLSAEGSADPDADGFSNIEEYHAGLSPIVPSATWYVDASIAESGDGTSWQKAFKTIQEGVDAASERDTVVVAQGAYSWFSVEGKNITMLSTNPFDRAVVEGTIIEGGVAFAGGEDQTCMLSGFTIQNGYTDFGYGGGISGAGYHAMREAGTHATIKNNTIRRNHAEYGGGLAFCDGIIENNVISDNTAGGEPHAPGFGGGLYSCNGTIRNNTIVWNSAPESMVYDPEAQWWKWVKGDGGGLYLCNGLVEGNFIVYNHAQYGGGLYLCLGAIQSNLIAGNGADSCGGGLADCHGMIQNNTICRNYAGETGAALAWCEGTIRNSIIWDNNTPEGAQVLDSSNLTYSSIEGWTGGGEGNISEDPRFVDAENGDFRLLPDSPCVDAGFNDPQLPGTDIAGMHRVMFGGKSLTVDMGAYEFYINDLTRGPTPHETTFTWSSLADKTYSIFHTEDLLTWHLAIVSFPSFGNTITSWTDDGSLTGLPPSLVPRRFYRVLENP